jgi:hypothetical protein
MTNLKQLLATLGGDHFLFDKDDEDSNQDLKNQKEESDCDDIIF